MQRKDRYEIVGQARGLRRTLGPPNRRRAEGPPQGEALPHK
jgi:hypothetical protein